MSTTFLHSGKIGDIIASLGAIKAYCEVNNTKAVYLIDPTGGTTVNDPETNEIVKRQCGDRGKIPFSDGAANFILPLIKAQPYVEDARLYGGEKVDINFNRFRKGFSDVETVQKTGTNLLYMQQDLLGVKMEYPADPWITVQEPKTVEGKNILVSRSLRYQSAHGFIESHFLAPMAENGYFIGTDLEYQAFVEAFGINIPRIEVKDALEAAQYAAGAQEIFSNGTMMYWIAAGLRKTIFHEVGVGIPSTLFRENDTNISYLEGCKQRFSLYQMSILKGLRK